MALSQYQATLVSAFLTSVLFGLYISFSIRCSLIMWNRWRMKRKVHPYMLATHIALVLLVTARCIAVIVRAILPVITETYVIRDVWTRDTVFVDACWMISLIISDAFVCYRVYIVWARNIYAPILSVALILANICLMALRLRIEADAQLGESNLVLYFVKLGDATIHFAIVALILNILNTGLITYRIWSVRRKTAKSRMIPTDTLSNVVSLVVESAALYTILMVLDIIFLSLDNYLLLVFQDIQCPYIGCVFCSIIIRVAEGSAFGDTTTSSRNPTGGTSDYARRTSRAPFPTEITMQTIISTHADPAPPLPDPKDNGSYGSKAGPFSFVDLTQDSDGKDSM